MPVTVGKKKRYTLHIEILRLAFRRLQRIFEPPRSIPLNGTIQLTRAALMTAVTSISAADAMPTARRCACLSATTNDANCASDDDARGCSDSSRGKSKDSFSWHLYVLTSRSALMLICKRNRNSNRSYFQVEIILLNQILDPIQEGRLATFFKIV
jgi:hypothetical protein